MFVTPLLAHLILIPVKQGLRDFVFLGNVLRTTLALAWQNFHPIPLIASVPRMASVASITQGDAPAPSRFSLCQAR